MKPQKPGAAFRAQVELANATINDWDRAWQITSRTHKELYDAMMAKAPASSFANIVWPARQVSNQAAIIKGVHDLMDKANAGLPEAHKIDYTQAWRQFAFEHPEFANEMRASQNYKSAASMGAFSSDKFPDQGGNSDGKGPPRNADGTPVNDSNEAKKQNANGVSYDDLGKYSLPFDATIDERDACASAVSTAPQKLFDTLVKFTMRQRNVGADAAAAYCAGRFGAIVRNAKVAGVPIRSSQGESFDASKLVS